MDSLSGRFCFLSAATRIWLLWNLQTEINIYLFIWLPYSVDTPDQWSPTFPAQWTSRGGGGCGGSGEKREWFCVGALLSQMQRRTTHLSTASMLWFQMSCGPALGCGLGLGDPCFMQHDISWCFQKVMNFASFQITIGESYHKKLQITLWHPLQSGFFPLKWLGKGIDCIICSS